MQQYQKGNGGNRVLLTSSGETFFNFRFLSSSVGQFIVYVPETLPWLVFITLYIHIVTSLVVVSLLVSVLQSPGQSNSS